MGAPKKADWREERRKRAWELKEQDWQQKGIAVALGVSEGAVSQWLKRGREGGVGALKAHPPKGVTPSVNNRAKSADPPVVSQGSGSVWFSWRCADSQPSSRGDRSDHWGALSS